MLLIPVAQTLFVQCCKLNLRKKFLYLATQSDMKFDMDYQLSRDGDDLFVSPQDLWRLRSELRNQDLNYLIDAKPAWRPYPSDLEYIVTLEEQRLGQKLSAVIREFTQRRMIGWVKLKAGNVEFEEARFSESSDSYCMEKVFIPRHVKEFRVAKLQVFVAVDEELDEDRERIEAACRQAVGIREGRDSFKFVAGPWSKDLHALFWKSQAAPFKRYKRSENTLPAN